MGKQMSPTCTELRAVALLLDSVAEELKGGTCVLYWRTKQRHSFELAETFSHTIH